MELLMELSKVFVVPICVVVLMLKPQIIGRVHLATTWGLCVDIWGGCFAKVKNHKIIT
jgi:hypothetical protein